jgi:hypothetical protein
MIYKLEIWDSKHTYMAPSGTLYTPERIKQDFEAIDVFPHVIQTDENGEMCWAVMNLSAMRSQYEIDPSLSEGEAIAKLEEIINTPPEEPQIDDSPTPTERIAAAMEYQNLMSM